MLLKEIFDKCLDELGCVKEVQKTGVYSSRKECLASPPLLVCFLEAGLFYCLAEHKLRILVDRSSLNV